MPARSSWIRLTDLGTAALKLKDTYEARFCRSVGLISSEVGEYSPGSERVIASELDLGGNNCVTLAGWSLSPALQRSRHTSVGYMWGLQGTPAFSAKKTGP